MLLQGHSFREARSRSQSQSSPAANPVLLPSTIVAHMRRGRPSQVQTSFSTQNTVPSVDMSSVTPSSATSTSLHESPIMTPEMTGLTTGASSVQVSPEIHASPDNEFIPPPTPLVLPESVLPEHVLSRQGSTNSLAHHQNLLGTSLPHPESLPKERTGFIRRFSTRRKNGSTRRQSSATPKVRDDSAGPAILRRRSDSNTGPPDFPPAVASDSEDDVDKLINFPSAGGSGFESPLRLDGVRSASISLGGSSNSFGFSPGLTVPPSLTQGTFVTKVKLRKQRRFALNLDLDNARLLWEKKFIDVDRIREIRTGSDTSQTRLDCGVPDNEKDRFFSIIYDQSDSKAKKKTLNLLCDDAETQKNWTETLDQMISHRVGQMASLSAFHEKAVKEYWETEMAKKFGDEPHSAEDEQIDFDGVERLCNYLHIWASPSQLRAKFHVADARGTGRLSYPEFLTFIGLMKQREDVATIHKMLAKESLEGLTLERFLEFLRDVQGEDVHSNLQRWEKIFETYTRKPGRQAETAIMKPPTMNEEQLASFLTSVVQNSPLLDPPRECELDRPLNEYFISSSHNTYLLGRQVASQSTIEGYIAALVGGCRCVEVDCWDGPDNNPVVKHGYALTTHISFKEVMSTINRYAFHASEFPLWISLEVHCSPAQQETMAVMIKEAFGDALVTEPLDPSSDQLPSPSQLKGRILVKVKKPGETQNNDATGRRRGNSLTSPSVSSPFARPFGPDLPTAASSPNTPLISPANSTRSSSVTARKPKAITEGEVHGGLLYGSDSDGYVDGGVSTPKKMANVKIVKTLGELGVYNQGIKFNATLDGPDSRQPNHIYSLMESTFNKFCERNKENKRAIFRHNMRYFMRVYPDQVRIKSNNFDPLIYWRRGVQMCALNWQTYDLPMQLNQAMFAGGTDRSGYVLKPQELRQIQRVEAATKEFKSKRPRKEVRFTIEVISAQQLTSTVSLPANKSFDPYVEVEIYHANDKRDKKENRSSVMSPVENLRGCTEVVSANGFNPVFNRTFEFVVTTKFPELIFVRWTVRLSQDGLNPNPVADRSPPLAVYTAKLLSLKKGYRTLPLYNHRGDRYVSSTLFCRTTVNHEDISEVFLPCREENLEPAVNVLKSIGRSIFSRTNTLSRSTDSAP